MARVTALGGLFFKSKDPAALAAWYRDVLGLATQSWGGAKIPVVAESAPPYAVWSAFPETSEHFAPGTARHMINFAVDDIDGFARQLEAKGVPIVGREDQDPFGRFLWVIDPDGTKIELWEPKRKP